MEWLRKPMTTIPTLISRVTRIPPTEPPYARNHNTGPQWKEPRNPFEPKLPDQTFMYKGMATPVMQYEPQPSDPFFTTEVPSTTRFTERLLSLRMLVLFVTWLAIPFTLLPHGTPLRGSFVLPSSVFTGNHLGYRYSHFVTIQTQFAASH